MTAAVFLQTLRSLPPEVDIREGFVAESTLDVNVGEECIGYIDIDDGTFVSLDEDEDGKRELAFPEEAAAPASPEEKREGSSEVEERASGSSIKRATLLETVQSLPPEATFQEPIDETGKLEVYGGKPMSAIFLWKTARLYPTMWKPIPKSGTGAATTKTGMSG